MTNQLRSLQPMRQSLNSIVTVQFDPARTRAQGTTPPLVNVAQLPGRDLRATDCAAPCRVTTILLPMHAYTMPPSLDLLSSGAPLPQTAISVSPIDSPTPSVPAAPNTRNVSHYQSPPPEPISLLASGPGSQHALSVPLRPYLRQASHTKCPVALQQLWPSMDCQCMPVPRARIAIPSARRPFPPDRDEYHGRI